VSIRNWKKQGKLWVADVPMFNGRPLDFRQLWVDGQKATRARDVEDFEICIAFAVSTRRLKLFMCLPPPFGRLRMGKAR